MRRWHQGFGMEVLTTAEMERADRLTIAEGTPGFALMMSAGQAVAEAAMDLVEQGPIVVVAGRGNNGGDGFVAGAELAPRGRGGPGILLCERGSLQGDAASAARGWKYPVLPFNPQAIGKPALIIDALLGAGLNRAVKGEPCDMIEAINANGAPVLAVDLASGINGTTGAVMGAAVRASESITFFRKKPGHLLLPGRIYCGRVRVAEIGIKASVLAEINPRTFENSPALWRGLFPVPDVAGHKYRRGHAVVVSGGASHTGAARLAAMAALRAGAGLVTIASPRDALAINATAELAVMVRPVDDAPELEMLLADRRFNAVAIGPGGGVGVATRELVLAVLGGDRAAVIDADGLTSFAQDGIRDALFAALAANGRAVLTPHAGEFHRLFGGVVGSSGAKTDIARAAARKSGAIVVFKGPDTVIAGPDGRAAINANAPPWLATAGTGDVLAGLIAGLLAEGMPPFEAACAGVWIHGEAADIAGPGMISEDLAPLVPEVYA